MSNFWSLMVIVVCLSRFSGTGTVSGVWQIGILGSFGPLNLGGMIEPLGPVGLRWGWLVSRDLSTCFKGSETELQSRERRMKGEDRGLSVRLVLASWPLDQVTSCAPMPLYRTQLRFPVPIGR